MLQNIIIVKDGNLMGDIVMVSIKGLMTLLGTRLTKDAKKLAPS